MTTEVTTNASPVGTVSLCISDTISSDRTHNEYTDMKQNTVGKMVLGLCESGCAKRMDVTSGVKRVRGHTSRVMSDLDSCVIPTLIQNPRFGAGSC